ncbi:unnamed protein product [Didymodactylos carnosus]|uniref:ZZ-type domain-containing protein n=1 Tax=Didymodactylos carnosus TaxID=1234261 RepID=A0A814HTE0_9BILA|nr:unnamed protein product [Didymodactylos carnosus]CAF1015096.1 unnamed protein product [Didymodactylos carnosus]CAF3509501.1 unnamed protein product [Didymodactylos carnosus]CAF3786634.1 unnamed protein product [Didymodactylos carnosus]
MDVGETNHVDENLDIEKTNGLGFFSEVREKLYDIISNKLEPLSQIKFAAYRVAGKLRVLQKYLKLTYVDYNVLVRAFNTHKLQFGEAGTIKQDEARKVLCAIYQLLSPYHFNESSIDEIIDTLLEIMKNILDAKSQDYFDVNAFKIILFALSNAKLPEKYRCFFRQVTHPNVIASQGKLTELFEILLKLPNYFDKVDPFHYDNIPACVQSCLDHTHDGIVREDIFVNWMGREPQTLVWLPTMHRLIATETVRHEARCDTCKAYPIIGMRYVICRERYRCLRCFNYDLCQKCFFTGTHARTHDGSHPIEEYCKQVTPFEDLKAFYEFVKLKFGNREVKRKERYLTIERSKSFCDTPSSSANSSSHLMNGNGNGNTMLRQDNSTRKILLNEIYKPIPKSDTMATTLSHPSDQNEQVLPLVYPSGYDNVPENQTGGKKLSPLKKKLIFDEPLLKKEQEDMKTKGNKNNYMNLNGNMNNKKIDYAMINKKQNIPHEILINGAPVILPKQHLPTRKNSSKNIEEHLLLTDHYKLPPIDKSGKDEDEDDGPPLPPKQRQNSSRALVYDFIGSELQELRATLAQFEDNSLST